MVFSKYYAIGSEDNCYCFVCLIELNEGLELSIGICNNCNHDFSMVMELNTLITTYNGYELKNKIVSSLHKILL